MVGQLKLPNWVNHLTISGMGQVTDVVYEAGSDYNLFLQRKETKILLGNS